MLLREKTRILKLRILCEVNIKSRQSGLRFPVALTSLLVIFSLCGGAARSEPGGQDITFETIYTIKSKVEEIRGLKFKEEVKVVMLGSDEMLAVTEKIMAKQGMDSGRMSANEKTMKAFGLLPDDFHLETAVRALIEEQVQGIYDPSAKTLYVRNDMTFQTPLGVDLPADDSKEKRIAISHELTHALQDQRFNLARIVVMMSTDGDRAYALNAVAEGDATIVMLDYGMSDMGFEMNEAPLFANFMESFMFTGSSGQFSTFKSMPAALKTQFLSPYTDGMKFVSKMYKDGGWPLVNYALKNPPESSEQILHPDKYLYNRDNPVVITLPDLSRYASPGAVSIDNNNLGELMTRLLTQAPDGNDSRAAAEKAAAGWGGDRYELYASPDGSVSLFWLSSWDAPEAAAGFYLAFSAALSRRFASDPISPSPDILSWKAPCGGAAIVKSGNDIAFIYCAASSDYSAIASAMFASARKTVDSKPPDIEELSP